MGYVNESKFQAFAANVDAALKTLGRLRRRMKMLEVEAAENGYDGGAFPTALPREKAAALKRLREWLEDATNVHTLGLRAEILGLRKAQRVRRNAKVVIAAAKAGDAAVLEIREQNTKGATKRK